jgi:hypothetical protein
MGRRIVTQANEAAVAGGGAEVDGYLERVIKYIPTEIVAAWVPVKNIVVASLGGSSTAVLWVCFVVGLALTGGYIYTRTLRQNLPPAWLQIGLSMVAFVVWVWALGAPFTAIVPNSEMYASLMLILFTLVVGLVVPNN